MDQNNLPAVKYCLPPGETRQAFQVYHCRIPPAQQIAFHQHEELEISYIIKGAGKRIMGSILEEFCEGEIVFIPSNIPHCWNFDNSSCHQDRTIENISIFISPQVLEALGGFSEEINDALSGIRSGDDVIAFGGEVLEQMQKLMAGMLCEDKLEQFSSLVKLFSLIAKAAEGRIAGKRFSQDRQDRRMQDAHRFIINNFHKKITLADAADFLGMERSSFSTFFKKATGQSFFEFLTRYRIESSCQMLLKSTMTVAEISALAGFSDVPHFNRVFKKIKKNTPTAFRNSLH